MEFQDTPGEAAFRAEVREFIAQNLPGDYDPDMFRSGIHPESPEAIEISRRWQKSLATRGWNVAHWPKEYGGAGLSPTEHFIMNEELAMSRAPGIPPAGVNMLGPTLIIHGSDAQRKEHLPKIASGETLWAQGYSEPGAGSDLASLTTRAEREGDEYVINGQKIWTSSAHLSQWIFMLARTDPEAPKHRGISMFILPLKTPGLTVRPLYNMMDDHGFNEVFFDDVRVPAANLVGEENRGWYIGATLLDFERSNIAQAISAGHAQRRIVAYAKQVAAGSRGLSSSARTDLADRSIEVEVSRLLAYNVISIQKRGRVPNHEASVNKVFRSEMQQRISRTGVKVAGLYGLLRRGSPRAQENGKFAEDYMLTVGDTIAGGTAEIQRNVIATRGLGLPRS